LHRPGLGGYRHPVAAAFWQIRRREQAEGVDWLPGAECRGGITGDLFAYLSRCGAMSLRVLTAEGRFVKPCAAAAL